MNAHVVDRKRLDLREDPNFLSPPWVQAPLYQCAIAVVVHGYVATANIEVQVNGASVPIVNGGFPYPHGVTVPLPALVAGQKVRARQIKGPVKSGWSPEITVGNHTQEFPAGPPRPEINPAPVYRCGIRTGVSNLLIGGNVWITANGTEVGRVDGCSAHQGVNVNPAYGASQKVRAWFELCKDPSPPSVEHDTQNPPAPLPPCGFEPYVSGGHQITVNGVVNGAKVTLYRNGAPVGTWGCWGYALSISGLSTIQDTDVFGASQQMCPGDPPSPIVESHPLPCSSLPAPQVGPVQAGDQQITLVQWQPDATIKVWINSQFAGAGAGPVVLLNKVLVKGDIVHVVQDLDGCPSQFALEIKVACVDPPVSGNPAWLNLFPVGRLEYNSSGIKGSVYYPAQDDGESQPFNVRLAALGRVPIVFMVHGMHSPADPSYLGYDYFQHDLAKMGIIAVSIDANALNNGASGFANIEDRAEMIIDHIVHFKGLDADPSSVFNGHIDFGRVGLMGHSRGGEAVVVVPNVISVSGVTIKSALALAPTNWANNDGLPTVKPAPNHAFMTILPAGDGDVRRNNGAQHYDLAVPGPFKSQLYVHFANHNFFNRKWLDDDTQWTPPQPLPIARFEHERILTAYGCALFRATLLGHNTAGYLSGDVLPAGVMTVHVYRSFEQSSGVLTVDHHEDGNTIAKNSLGEPTTQNPANSADEFAFSQAGPAFNASFFGETTGMVVKPGDAGRTFRSQLKRGTDMRKSEIWIRTAEVTDGQSVAAGATGFKLGVEDDNGVQAWVDSDEVSGLPRPYARNPGMIKSMLNTLRFKGACFSAPRLNLRAIRAILLHCDRPDKRAFAFDVLQIVK
jgi:dienelactone hydrolase